MTGHRRTQQRPGDQSDDQCFQNAVCAPPLDLEKILGRIRYGSVPSLGQKSKAESRVFEGAVPAYPPFIGWPVVDLVAPGDHEQSSSDLFVAQTVRRISLSSNS
jgi:hypothetical protein